MPDTRSHHRKRLSFLYPQGPGAYNLRLDQRVEAMMAEQEEFDNMASQFGSFGSEDSSLTESQPSIGPARTMGMMTTGSRGSLRSRSVKSQASELGIKFGDIPTHNEAPTFSFGNSDRATRAKVD
jgi:hypothetical protein